jgi:ribose transport system ATP-binding protein/rhamnose transport system ATP-binding protein
MTPVVEMLGVVKSYSGLRPLRIQSLSVAESERVSIVGLDAVGAEVFVNLVTGASVPDTGEVRVFGRNTAAVADGDEWLASLDAFGIVTGRAVVLEGATVGQNLALPFTLEIDPLAAETLAQVRRLADECEIAPQWIEQRAGDVPAELRARLHFARAIALEPRLLLMEHPTANLPEGDRVAFGALVARVGEARGLSVLAITLDPVFASHASQRTLTLQPATGQLVAAKRSWWQL